MIINEPLGTNGHNILSMHYALHNCWLSPDKTEELYSIAREADARGELALLGLKLVTLRNGSTRLCDSRWEGRRVTYPTINTYLLVIGKATPESRNKFLTENPQYRRFY
jgi:hypothetical protein